MGGQTRRMAEALESHTMRFRNVHLALLAGVITACTASVLSWYGTEILAGEDVTSLIYLLAVVGSSCLLFAIAMRGNEWVFVTALVLSSVILHWAVLVLLPSNFLWSYDGIAGYALSNRMLQSGRWVVDPSQGSLFFVGQYQYYPGMHVFYVAYSEVTGADLLQSMKLGPTFMSILGLVGVYLLLRAVLRNVHRGATLARLGAFMFGLTPMFILFYTFPTHESFAFALFTPALLCLLKGRKWTTVAAFIVFLPAIAATHHFTGYWLIITAVALSVARWRFASKEGGSGFLPLLTVVMILGWGVFVASALLVSQIGYIGRLLTVWLASPTVSSNLEPTRVRTVVETTLIVVGQVVFYGLVAAGFLQQVVSKRRTFAVGWTLCSIIFGVLWIAFFTAPWWGARIGFPSDLQWRFMVIANVFLVPFAALALARLWQPPALDAESTRATRPRRVHPDALRTAAIVMIAVMTTSAVLFAVPNGDSYRPVATRSTNVDILEMSSHIEALTAWDWGGVNASMIYAQNDIGVSLSMSLYQQTGILRTQTSLPNGSYVVLWTNPSFDRDPLLTQRAQAIGYGVESNGSALIYDDGTIFVALK